MIKVRVPATTANLGSGFDTLGLALSLYNTFSFQEIPKGLEISGCEKDFANENNLVYTSMLYTFKKIGYTAKGIKIGMETDIPISRGLGSSAACILAGVIGGGKIAGANLSKEEILEIATEIEGHPDNIAPALLGGLTISIVEDGRVICNQVDIPKGIKFVALIPDFTLSTKEARDVLPSTILYKDAIYNIGRVALLISSLANGKFDLLKFGVEDKLHQPYRGELIPGFNEIINKCKKLNSLGVFISGAGPTIMAIIDENDNDFIIKIDKYFKSMNYNWNVKALHIDLIGATLLKSSL